MSAVRLEDTQGVFHWPLAGDRHAALVLASRATDAAELQTWLHMTGLLAEGPHSREGSPLSVAEKPCGMCGLVKGAAEFHRDRQSPDGLKWWCAPCVNEYNRARRARPARVTGSKRCHVCELVKAAGEFYANRRNHDGLSHRCKSCNAAAVRAWRAAHPEAVKAHQEADRARRNAWLTEDTLREAS